MARLGPILLLFLVVTGGCLGPNGGGCHEVGPWETSWTEPGLFARMPPDGAINNYTVTQFLPAPGLPFQDDGFDEILGPMNYSLRSVSWSPSTNDPNYPLNMLELTPLLLVSGSFEPPWSHDAIHEAFTKFVGNVSAAPMSHREDWAASFLDSEEPVPSTGPVEFNSYWARVDGPFRLEELHARLMGSAARNESDGGPVDAEGDSWNFAFAFAYARAEAGSRSLEVDAWNQAKFTLSSEFRPTEPEVERAVRETFAALGVGQPSPVRWVAAGRTDCPTA